jgi:hypothetical protein
MNASPEDWTAFTDSITRTAERSGMTRADAEDIAQDLALKIVEGRFAKNAENLRQAFGLARAIARRAGSWAALGDQTNRDRHRHNQARRMEGFQFHVRDESAAFPSPDRMAAAAEAKGFPVSRVHETYGIGPTALAEPGTTPSVCGSGPGWTMPEPIPADRYPTDPNPVGRIVAALAVANDARRVAGLPPVR